MSLDDEQCSCYSSSLNPGYYSCCLSFHQFQDNAFCFELPLQRLCRGIVLFIFFSLQTLQSLVYFVIYSLQFKSLFLCQNCQFTRHLQAEQLLFFEAKLGYWKLASKDSGIFNIEEDEVIHMWLEGLVYPYKIYRTQSWYFLSLYNVEDQELDPSMTKQFFSNFDEIQNIKSYFIESSGSQG